MVANHANGAEELRFVDPSIDPSIFLDISKFLAGIGLRYIIVKIVKTLWRFSAVEYAVGFDGIDDLICIDDLDIRNDSIDIETSIWISRNNQGFELLDLANSDGDSILGLTDTTDENLEIRAIYRNDDEMQNVVLSRIESEAWHNLRIWSDGNVFSIEVDGTQVGIIPGIDLEDGPFKLHFGRGCHSYRYFRGMVKHLQVKSGANKLFYLQGDEDFEIKDETDSADLIGIHKMKKGRFRKEFRA